MFIVLEGVDGCGKTLQQGLLVERLVNCGRVPLTCKFPSKRPAGYAARQLLRLDWTAHDDPDMRAIVTQAVMIADKYNSAPEIQGALRVGGDVVCSRWRDSGEAYGAAEGLDLAWIRDAQALLPIPDLIVLIDVPVAAAMLRARVRGPRDRYEHEAFQTKVRDQYLRLQHEDSLPARRIMVDGAREPQVVHDEIWSHVCAVRRRLEH